MLKPKNRKKLRYNSRPDLAKAILKREYIDNNLSTQSIAEKYNSNATMITRRLQYFGIPLRTMTEAQEASVKSGKRSVPLHKTYTDVHGYVQEWDPERKRFVAQHRLVMERHLKRRLDPTELVHHLNGIKTNNRLENLGMTNPRNHPKRTLVELLQARIRELESS